MSTQGVLLDTNVLLSATDPTRRHHRAAQRLLRNDRRELSVSTQVMREYLAVATRPAELNGLALSPFEAAVNVRSFAASLRIVHEDSGTFGQLVQLVHEGRASGRQVHDANVVATALAHGASTIVTSDTRHFARFADLIEVEALAEEPAEQ